MVDMQRRNRKSLRLKEHDYSCGSYFVTVRSEGGIPLFGRVRDQAMIMNEAGGMVETVWLDICRRFPNVVLDSFIVMPDHFHGIVDLGIQPQNAHILFDIMRFFKSQSTALYIKGVRENQWQGFDRRLWQRNYFERNIRNDDELKAYRQYIINNPADYTRIIHGYHQEK